MLGILIGPLDSKKYSCDDFDDTNPIRSIAINRLTLRHKLRGKTWSRTYDAIGLIMEYVLPGKAN